MALSFGCNNSAVDEGSTSETSASDTNATGSESVGSETDTETETGETGEPEPADYSVAGPYPVGNVAFELSGDRALAVELWYPASTRTRATADQGQAVTAFVPDEPDASTFAGLIATGSEACVRNQTRSAANPELAEIAGSWPTVVFSHCHGCARFSSYSLAERLASHGFLVAAVDHAGSTLFDQLGGGLPPLDQATLELRRDDVVRVMDELLDPAASELPAAFIGLADGDRLGVFGHSFGAVTTGKVLQDDPRPRAGAAIAAPIENPLIPGVTMAGITEPLLMIVAVEDNSITEFGNNAIRTNFSAANTPVWKLEFADTGHFAFSDLAGLSDYFAAGCGDGIRQTNDEPFVYADPFVVRDLAATRVTAFFALHLLDDSEAQGQLEAQDPLLKVDVRE